MIQKFVVTEFIIQFSKYHSEILGRLKYRDKCGNIEESQLCKLSDIPEIISLWKDDNLMGSFAIGTRLAEHAVMNFEQ